MRLYESNDSILAGAELAPILNSVTVTVGDALKLSHASNYGGADAADAITDRIYSICVGISDESGISLVNLTATTDYDGTYTNALSGDTYVAAADNVTDKKIQAQMIPIGNHIIEATLSDGSGTAQERGTTTGSDQIGYYLSVDTSDSTMLDETSASTSSEQFIIVKNHPIDSTKVLVKAVEMQRYN